MKKQIFSEETKMYIDDFEYQIPIFQVFDVSSVQQSLQISGHRRQCQSSIGRYRLIEKELSTYIEQNKIEGYLYTCSHEVSNLLQVIKNELF